MEALSSRPPPAQERGVSSCTGTLAAGLGEDCAGRQRGVVKLGGLHWLLTSVTSGKSLNFPGLPVLKLVGANNPPFPGRF